VKMFRHVDRVDLAQRTANLEASHNFDVHHRKDVEYSFTWFSEHSIAGQTRKQSLKW